MNKEKIEYLLTIKEYINLLFSTKEIPKYDIKKNEYTLGKKKIKILSKR